MKQSTKLLLDILMGAVIPILILNNLTRPLGAPTAYVLSALVPVAWVAIDLLVITKRFNFITSYVGASAILNGALAFWFVDGLLFALKDSAGFLLTMLIFGGSILIARPVVRYFVIQALNPDTPTKERSLHELLDIGDVRKALVLGTILTVVYNLLAGVFNFYLNAITVVAPFGVEQFNQQVAQVNAITRLALPLPNLLVFGVAIWLAYRALYRNLPSEGDKPQLESDFWELVALRDGGTADRQGA